MQICEYPIVPEVPETLKLNESVVESNVKPVTVEFESTEKTFWFWFCRGVKAKFAVRVMEE